MLILADAHKLKEFACYFLHPEEPVPSTLGTRCYFDRPSAPPCLSKEDADELSDILDDAKALKQSAIDFNHPEVKVVTRDPTAFGRNYFNRCSGPDQEILESLEGRSMILADAQSLKEIAIGYLHPELPVKTTDSTAVGRNYFSRSSAVEYDDAEYIEERQRILDDMRALKKLAVDYMHPEFPVVTSDPSACGRNYFTRPSASVQESEVDARERGLVLEDMKALKKLAVDYSHPEMPVVTTDPLVFGRNYFSRPSAPEYDTVSLMNERSCVLADVAQLKQLAKDYCHPELPVTADPTCFGRNFFTRPSAYVETLSDSCYRNQVMEDVKIFKKLAVDFLHPERPVVTTESTAYGRNYYSRPSAPKQESLADAKVRKEVIEDMKNLKKYALDYLHPEIRLSDRDPTCFARNFFLRPEGSDHHDACFWTEREQIFNEMKALKQLAVDYLHPEIPVITSDPSACGRNYFTRPSSLEITDVEQRDLIMKDVYDLRILARDYRHPERSVEANDPFRCARNFFARPSAYIGDGDKAERELVLQDAMALKKLAIDYKHPELPVKSDDPTACARNFFSRPSAVGHYGMIHTFPAHEDEVDDHHHGEHLDHFGMDDYGLDYELSMYGEIRENFPSFNYELPVNKQEHEDEGNLSRSPSSVMLFCDEMAT